MGDLAARYMSYRKKPEPGLSANEAKALERLQAEAQAHGVTLHSKGYGGLPPSMVLGLMRRDEWRCKRCGTDQDLTVHHKGGAVTSRWISRIGHRNQPNALAVVCHPCHDAIHDEARAEGVDSSQVLAEADQGTEHDHGQPLANPKT